MLRIKRLEANDEVSRINNHLGWIEELDRSVRDFSESVLLPRGLQLVFSLVAFVYIY